MGFILTVLAASADRLPPVWIGLIAGLGGLIMLPVLGAGLAGRLPIKNGWLMLAILLAYVFVVGGAAGFLFPGTWSLSGLAAWPLAPVVLPVVVALGAGYLASRMHKRFARAALRNPTIRVR